MGIFDKLFGKKETSKQANETQKVELKKGDVFISTGDNSGYKVIRKLTDNQREKIDKSTIQLMPTQLYMHYWTDNLVCA